MAKTFKPDLSKFIATSMRITEEQWNHAKPYVDRVEGVQLSAHIIRFGTFPYLVNNLHGKQLFISNVDHTLGSRIVHETYDLRILLKSFGLSDADVDELMFPEKWKIADTKENQEYLIKLCKKNGIDLGSYLCEEGSVVYKNSFYFLKDNELDWDDDNSQSDYTLVTLEQLKAHYGEGKSDMIKCSATYPIKKEPALKLTITRTELLEIYNIACEWWKNKIKQYAGRLDLETDTITFTKAEVEAMFKAAVEDQPKVLQRIFGNPRITELETELAELDKQRKVIVEAM